MAAKVSLEQMHAEVAVTLVLICAFQRQMGNLNAFVRTVWYRTNRANVIVQYRRIHLSA